MGAPAVLPLPVAVLVRRARNAKSPKDRHDTAYFAWEASVRLAVAARPPGDVAPLVSASVGHWVGALRVGDVPLDAPALLEVCALFEEVALGERPKLRSVKPRRLVGTLPGYRNLVIGHGSTRTAAFYDRAAPVLLAGLDAAWAESVFLARGSRLVYAQAVEIDPSGERRARLLELSGDAGHIVDPRGTRGIPEDMLPRRLYLRDGARYEPLYPWVLFEEEELRERVLFFNGLRRRPAYLDYASGEAQRGAELAGAFPGVEAEVFALFSQEPSEDPEPEDDDPDLFGDYRILGKLGEGGMGVVYLARQESLGRLVALKMLPAHAVDSPVAVARFRREVAALSRCEHRNVVKILASGTARGTHYYAMEYVEGADLGRIYEALSSSEDFESAVSTAADAVRTERDELFEHAPEVPRSTPATARQSKARYRQLAVAFRDAARGVHHLHESGVIHRDIKPGNLMVTAADHRVVVMDLGLAAVADASRSITRDKGQILGTLRYMPPEQLQRNLLQVDHRADVYALGATFYELLCERAFFDGDSEARVIEQVLREEPLHPSKANPRLPGDLATIVRKATEKDPKLRYDSADALSEDLDAYLEGRPITARPPTLGYLLRLAIRRNKALAATVAVAVVALVGVVAFFLISLRAERDRAVRERARAETLANFMLFDLRDGLEPLGRLDLLESVALKTLEYHDTLPVEGASDESLRQRASVFGNVGDVLAKQGNLPRALASYRESLAIDERLAAKDPTHAEAQYDLSVTHERIGGVLSNQGQLEAALASHRAALAICEHWAAVYPTDTHWQRALSVSLDRVGNVLLEQSDDAAALARYQEAFAIRRGLTAKDPTNATWQIGLARSLTKIGDVLHLRQDLPGALASYEDSLAIRELLAEQDSTNATWHNGLSLSLGRVGSVLLEQRDYAGALASYQKALAIRRGLAAKDPTNAVLQSALSESLDRVGNVLLEQSDEAVALARYQEALAIRTSLAAKDPSNATWENDLGQSLRKVGDVLHLRQDLPGALASYKELLAICERRAAEDSADLTRQSDVSAILDKVGNVLLEQRDYAEALASYQRSLTTCERLVAKDPTNATWQSYVSLSLDKVGNVLLEQSDDAGALAKYQEALAIRRGLAAKDPTNATWQSYVSLSLDNVGNVLLEQRDLPGALTSYKEALAVREPLGAKDSASAASQNDLSVALTKVGGVLLEQRDYAGALASYQKALTIWERLAANDPTNAVWQPGLLWSLDKVGDVLQLQGDALVKADVAGALASYQEALAIRERLAAKDSTNTASQRDLSVSLSKVGDVLHRQGELLVAEDVAGALATYQEVLAIRERLVAQEPTNAAWQRDLSVTQYFVGDALLRLDRAAEATTILEHAEATHRRAMELESRYVDEHRSWERRLRGAELLAGVRPTTSPGDRLELAYALFRLRESASAAEHFAVALEDEALRADLDRANLYNAACSAALATAAGGETAATWRARAFDWLREDLRLRSEMLGQVDERLAAGPPEEAADGLRKARAAILHQFEWARTGDSDLAALRGAEFDALFDGLPAGE